MPRHLELAIHRPQIARQKISDIAVNRLKVNRPIGLFYRDSAEGYRTICGGLPIHPCTRDENGWGLIRQKRVYGSIRMGCLAADK